MNIWIKMRNIVIITIAFLFVFVTMSVAKKSGYKLKEGDVVISDFEFDPSNFGGKIACYGAVGAKTQGGRWPYSGYTAEESYSGKKSFRCVFTKHSPWQAQYEEDYDKTPLGMQKIKSTKKMTKSKEIDWAVFSIDMGPVIDTSVTPVKIQPVDISKFRYLVFWVRGGSGGEKFKVYFRDMHALTYEPQAKITPDVKVDMHWQPVAVDLQDRRLRLEVDLTKIVQIAVGFGRPDGGQPGNVLYIDNVILVK